VAVVTIGLAAGATLINRTHRGKFADIREPTTTTILTIGEPEDWTEKARVLADIPGRILCIRALSPGQSVRFVWGHPRRVEELAVETGHRAPSSLVPEAYAEGCPDLSPDGHRLLYQGHTKDGRAAAFVSAGPDGRDARAETQTAEPTVSSEPTWLPDGENFSFDLDANHLGIFSVRTRRITAVRDLWIAGFYTFFRTPASRGIVTASVLANSRGTEVVSLEWPSLAETNRFRVPGLALDVCSWLGTANYYYATPLPTSELMWVDPIAGTARRLGKVPGQLIRYATAVASGLVFASVRKRFLVLVRQASGAYEPLGMPDTYAEAAPCGPDIIATRRREQENVVVRLDRQGHLLAELGTGPTGMFPACSSDGRVAYFIDEKSMLKRCEAGRCVDLYEAGDQGLAISLDGRRVVFVKVEQRGLFMYWGFTEGGSVREIGQAETFCSPPAWSGPTTLWILTRREGRFEWREYDVDTRKDTGRTLPGRDDCADPDYVSPSFAVDPEVKVEIEERSQLRFLSASQWRESTRLETGR